MDYCVSEINLIVKTNYEAYENNILISGDILWTKFILHFAHAPNMKDFNQRTQKKTKTKISLQL